MFRIKFLRDIRTDRALIKAGREVLINGRDAVLLIRARYAVFVGVV